MRTIIVDDDPKRIQWFHSMYPDTEFVTNASDAIKVLTKLSFDIVSLDHDLVSSHYTTAGLDTHDSDNCHNGGCDIARAMAASKIRHGSITVHSWNKAAAREMRRILQLAGIKSYALRAECG